MLDTRVRVLDRVGCALRASRRTAAKHGLDDPSGNPLLIPLDVGAEHPAYLAVEFVDGGTIHDLVRRHKRLPHAVALEIFAQLKGGSR